MQYNLQEPQNFCKLKGNKQNLKSKQRRAIPARSRVLHRLQMGSESVSSSIFQWYIKTSTEILNRNPPPKRRWTSALINSDNIKQGAVNYAVQIFKIPRGKIKGVYHEL